MSPPPLFWKKEAKTRNSRPYYLLKKEFYLPFLSSSSSSSSLFFFSLVGKEIFGWQMALWALEWRYTSKLLIDHIIFKEVEGDWAPVSGGREPRLPASRSGARRGPAAPPARSAARPRSAAAARCPSCCCSAPPCPGSRPSPPCTAPSPGPLPFPSSVLPPSSPSFPLRRLPVLSINAHAFPATLPLFSRSGNRCSSLVSISSRTPFLFRKWP